MKKPNTKKIKTIETKTFNFLKNRKETILSVIIVFCLPVLLYLHTVRFGFTNFDDNLIIQNHVDFLKDFRNVPQAFMTSAFTHESGHFYRPMQTLSYMIDINLSGGNNTWMYHLTNILLLGLIACLLFLLLKCFFVPLKLAVLSTLIYCAHPLFVSNIAWIPARGDLQLMLFSLLSFLLFIEFLKKRKFIYVFIHWITFTIALFCKETAIFLPFLCVIYYFSFYSEKRFDKKIFMNILLYIISGIFWFYMRSKAIGDLSNLNEILGMFGGNYQVGLIPLLQNLKTIPESLSSFFIPFNIVPIPNFSYNKFFIGLVIIFLIIVLFLKNKKRSNKEKKFCFFWFLLFLFPTMLYKHNIIDYLNHRFFLPMIGILLFTLFMFPEKWFKNGDIKNSLIIVIVLIILSSFTFVKSRSYSDPMTFYNSAISQNSNSALLYYNRGIIYSNQGLNDKAVNDYSKAIEIKHDYADAYNNRGYVYKNKGLYDKAINDYTEAIKLKPDYFQAYNNRGDALFLKGLFDNACSDFKKAEKLGSKEAKENITKCCK